MEMPEKKIKTDGGIGKLESHMIVKIFAPYNDFFYLLYIIFLFHLLLLRGLPKLSLIIS